MARTCARCATELSVTAAACPSCGASYEADATVSGAALVRSVGPPPGWSPLRGAPERIGRFEVRAELGRGAMGVVYRVYDPQLDAERALKLTLERADAAALTRFQAEAQTLARLDHPHLVRVHELGWWGPYSYFLQSFVRGRSLKDLLAQEQRLSPARALAICEPLARALAHAHAAGVVHRDVKPANVLLDEQEQPYLGDFGVARDHEVRERLTRTGELIGTAAYMAPEQAGGEVQVGPPADVFALGIVLYECLTGSNPFRRSGPIQTISAVIMDPAPSLPGERGSPLDQLLQEALAKDPGARPSAEELAQRLAELAAGEAPPAVPRGLWGALAGAGLLVLAAGAWGVTASSAPQPGVVVLEANLEANLEVDGVAGGALGPEAPRELSLSPGEHRLAFVREGLRHELSLRVEEAGRHEERVSLRGRLEVETEPSGHSVLVRTLSGERVAAGSSPYSRELPMGRYQLELRRPDARPRLHEVELLPAGLQRRFPLPGQLLAEAELGLGISSPLRLAELDSEPGPDLLLAAFTQGKEHRGFPCALSGRSLAQLWRSEVGVAYVQAPRLLPWAGASAVGVGSAEAAHALVALDPLRGTERARHEVGPREPVRPPPATPCPLPGGGAALVLQRNYGESLAREPTHVVGLGPAGEVRWRLTRAQLGLEPEQRRAFLLAELIPVGSGALLFWDGSAYALIDVSASEPRVVWTRARPQVPLGGRCPDWKSQPWRMPRPAVSPGGDRLLLVWEDLLESDAPSGVIEVLDREGKVVLEAVRPQGRPVASAWIDLGDGPEAVVVGWVDPGDSVLNFFAPRRVLRLQESVEQVTGYAEGGARFLLVSTASFRRPMTGQKGAARTYLLEGAPLQQRYPEASLRWEAPPADALPESAVHVAADFDGDGRPEVLQALRRSGRLRLWAPVLR